MPKIVKVDYLFDFVSRPILLGNLPMRDTKEFLRRSANQLMKNLFQFWVEQSCVEIIFDAVTISRFLFIDDKTFTLFPKKAFEITG